MTDWLTKNLQLVDPVLRSAYERDYIGFSPTLETLDGLIRVVEKDNEEQLRSYKQDPWAEGRKVFVSNLQRACPVLFTHSDPSGR